MTDADAAEVSPYRPPSHDDVAKLRTMARKRLAAWASSKAARSMIDDAFRGPTRVEEAATLRSLIALAETLDAWDFTKVKIVVDPLGVVFANVGDGELMAWHEMAPADAHRILTKAGHVKPDAGIWLLQVDESGQVCATTSRNALP